MEYIALHLKLMRGAVMGTLLVFVVWNYDEVANTLFWYSVYLNLEKEMIARAP